ncbi:MAG: type II toxin-antitoxin system death-on-curing family toxin [Oscillospiraceae bacterium]|jgi:death-on-curing protein|nr:type II toxin-antitoxin system death-on-curing family toxin [Oscillospiraceae bacterium]
MIAITKEQVISFHSELLEKTGGLLGIRDEGLLQSALVSPFQTFDGLDLFPSVIAKISRITYGIIKNHPFADGNKRIGVLVMLALLEWNGIPSEFTDDDLIRIGLDIANGEMSDKQLLKLILERMR